MNKNLFVVGITILLLAVGLSERNEIINDDGKVKIRIT